MMLSAPAKPAPMLLDQIRTLDQIRPRGDRISFKPDFLKPATTQAASQVHRPHYLHPLYDYVLPPVSPLDLKSLDDAAEAMKLMMTQVGRDMITGTKGMAIPMRRPERRDHPDFTAGLREALDDCRYGLGFGFVLHDQKSVDPAIISRWIWGPRGEFTGYSAGDRAFEDTIDEIHQRNRNPGPVVATLSEFDRLVVKFRFTPRYSYEDMRRAPHYMDPYHNGSRSIPCMIQFDTYEDQDQWRTAARYAGERELVSQIGGRVVRY